MARLIERIEGMTDFERGMTFSVGTIEGGTFVNVMPIECRAQVLTVAPTRGDLRRGRPRACAALESENDGIRVDGRARPGAPAVGAASRRPWRSSRRRTGLPPGSASSCEHGSFGGGSDGNFTGALGVATLDGLGVDGAGAHTFEEHLLVSSLVPRCRLFAELLQAIA